MLGDSTDTQNLNMICIISYSDILPFFEHDYHYKVYAIILISLHRTTGPSRSLFFVIRNKFVVLNIGKNTTIHGYYLIISHNPPTIRANVASS